DVGMDSARDPAARRAFAARVAVRSARADAIDGLCQGNGDETLPDPARSGKDEAGRKGLSLNRAREQRDQPAVTDDVPERHPTRIVSLTSAGEVRLFLVGLVLLVA